VVFYVQYLLLNYLTIKSKEDIELEEYQDLIILEKKLQYLLDNELISREDFDLLRRIINAQSIKILAKEMGKDYRTLVTFFQSMTDMLGNILGNTFCDEYWISHLSSKYNLNQEEIQKLKCYIEKPYRGE
jgi:hypothetical protein